GQLDLEPGLGGAGPGGEDVEYQLAAVKDLDVGGLFQVAHLGRRQVVVEDDHVGVGGLDLLLQLGELALADVGGGDDLEPFLQQAADDGGAGGGGQAAQLVERVFADPGPVRQ